MIRGKRSAPRGRPLATLVALLAVWIGGRTMLWEMPFAEDRTLAEALAPLLAENEATTPAPATAKTASGTDWSMSTSTAGGSGAASLQVYPDAAPGSETEFIWPEDSSAPGPAPLPASNPQIAASHQLMWLTALAYMPVPDVLSERLITSAGPDQTRPTPHAVEGRWSLDAWTLWRQGSGGSLVSQGRVPTYGASQAGAALSYRLVPANRHDPRAYLRLYHALIDQGEGEVALGLNARPFPKIPVRAYAELRATSFIDGTRFRPAILAATELAPQKLPAGLRAELYAQGGYVGGTAATGFADGQLHVLRDVKRFDLARISIGGGAWGGLQKDAHRLDLGPAMRADITFGKTPARISVDWRERVAGNADPESGLAVTLSTRF